MTATPDNSYVKMAQQSDIVANDPLADENLSPLLRQNILHIRPYLQMKGVTDLRIVKPKTIVIHYADGRREVRQDVHLSRQWLIGMCKLMSCITDQLFDEYTHPSLGFKLPGGHRVQVRAGSSMASKFGMAIRVKQPRKYDLASFGLDDLQQQHVKNAMKQRSTIMVSGGTGSGKTSFINTLIPMIPEYESINTIEDVQELEVPHVDTMSMLYSGNDSSVSGTAASDLFNDSLRMNPDRIIVGEIRQKNAGTFFHAIGSGHEGSMATIHANDPEQAIEKVCDYMVMNGDITSAAKDSTISMLQKNIGLVVQLTNDHNGKRQATLKVFAKAEQW